MGTAEIVVGEPPSSLAPRLGSFHIYSFLGPWNFLERGSCRREGDRRDRQMDSRRTLVDDDVLPWR